MSITIDRIVVTEDGQFGVVIEVLRPNTAQDWTGHSGHSYTFIQLCQRIVRWNQLGYAAEVFPK